jgi:hypothetical protein
VNQFVLATNLWMQMCWGAEVASYENVPDTITEPSCHFCLLHHVQQYVILSQVH